MSFFMAAVLGLVQGLGEFLPISSSGHLAIAKHLFGADAMAEVPAFFDVLLHLGTLGAVFVAYWSEIVEIVKEFFLGVRDLARHTTPVPVPPARRMLLLMIVGSLPLFAVLPIRDFIEGLENNLYFVGGALIVTGFLLLASDRAKKGKKSVRSATVLDVVIVGIFQLLGTCPGISRSGATISAGCFRGFERSFAVKFSFLLSIPAVLAANLLTVFELWDTAIIWEDVPAYLLGLVVSAVVGYLCLRLVKMLVSKEKFGGFAYYCWMVGLFTIVGAVIR